MNTQDIAFIIRKFVLKSCKYAKIETYVLLMRTL